MDSKVITFSNFKGGTGKTTNSTMTGIELARRGYKTLLIDLDPQANATNLYLKTKNNFGG
ncbi:ParA family protein, partial [Lactiplantibacillus plantarum]